MIAQSRHGHFRRNVQTGAGVLWAAVGEFGQTKVSKTARVFLLCADCVCTRTAFSLFSSSEENKRDEAQKKEDEMILLLKKAKVPEAGLKQKQELLHGARAQCTVQGRRVTCRGTGLRWSGCGIVTVML